MQFNIGSRCDMHAVAAIFLPIFYYCDIIVQVLIIIVCMPLRGDI